MGILSHIKAGIFLLTFPSIRKNLEVYLFYHETEIIMRRREEKRLKAVLDKPKIKIEYLNEED
jgi:hypothetical protein